MATLFESDIRWAVEREGNWIGGVDRSTTTARKFTPGGIMPTRGRIPRFLVLFVVAVAVVALVGFEIMKEQRIARANIGEKELQLEHVRMDLKVSPFHPAFREFERGGVVEVPLQLCPSWSVLFLEINSMGCRALFWYRESNNAFENHAISVAFRTFLNIFRERKISSAF